MQLLGVGLCDKTEEGRAHLNVRYAIWSWRCRWRETGTFAVTHTMREAILKCDGIFLKDCWNCALFVLKFPINIVINSQAF